MNPPLRSTLLKHYIAISLIYLVYLFIALGPWDFKLEINWAHTHLLDRDYLDRYLLNSMLYLHSQPPLFNFFTALILRAAWLFGTTPSVVAEIIYLLVGWAILLAIFEIGCLLTKRPTLSLIAPALVLINPGFAFFQFDYSYEFPLQLISSLVVLYSFKYIENGAPKTLLVYVVYISILSLTKSLFHPSLVIFLFLVLIFFRRMLKRPCSVRTECTASLLLILLITAWPLKNWLVFNHFTYSSWTGFNLIVRLPEVRHPVFEIYETRGIVGPRIQSKVDKFVPLRLSDDLSILKAAHKPSAGGLNWNHLIAMFTKQRQYKMGIQWRKENFLEWMKMTAGQYFMATRATYIFPYSPINAPFGTGNESYEQWQSFYNNILFYDLRPLVESIFPNFFVHNYAKIRGYKVLYSTFSLFFPFIIIVVLMLVARSRTSLNSEHLALVIICSLLVWTILLPCLTDGNESNRMRVSTFQLFSLLILYCIHKVQCVINNELLHSSRDPN